MQTPSSRTQIIEAALQVAEEKGPEGLNLRVVAALLGVEAMALYRHITGKADLEAGAADALLSRLPLPDDHLPWRVRLRQVLKALYTLALTHPRSFGLLYAAMVNLDDLESLGRLNLTLDRILRESHMPHLRVFQVRRFIIAGMIGYAHLDVQSMLKAGRSLTDQEAIYPVMAQSVEREVLDLMLETQRIPVPAPDVPYADLIQPTKAAASVSNTVPDPAHSTPEAYRRAQDKAEPPERQTGPAEEYPRPQHLHEPEERETPPVEDEEAWSLPGDRD